MKVGVEFENAGKLAGFMLWSAHNVWQSNIKKCLRPFELTHVQFVLLSGIYDLKRDQRNVSQVQLSDYVRADINMTSSVLASLEDRRLIRRKKHPKDRRAHTLSLTQKGRRVLKDAARVVVQFDTDFFQQNQKKSGVFTKTLSTLLDQHDDEVSL